MAKADLATQTHRATLFGAAALATASIAVSGSAKASTLSPAIQNAFDNWQQADLRYEAVEKKSFAALDRFNEIAPDNPSEKILADFPSSPLRRRLKSCFIRLWPAIITEATTGSEAYKYAWASADVQHALDSANAFVKAETAALEMSGLTAAEQDSTAAHASKEAAFEALIGTPPVTMADVRLQAKLLRDWLEGADTERPQRLWIKAITGEAWPHEDDETSNVEAA